MSDHRDETKELGTERNNEAAVSDETRHLTHPSEGEASFSVFGNIPNSIGRYHIERTLGQGGFGSVYLAKDDDLDRKVTIKVPHPNRIKSKRDLDAFLTEARTLAKLEHPHVVPVHDVGHTPDGVCYIVSRYIDGSDLRERMKMAPMSIGEAADLVAILAEALHYVHTHGVIHRDIKPGNILLDQRSVPYLADFGLALLENDAAKSRAVVGTPSYMSPEQARGENHLVQGTADIFSLGIVLYELVTGTRVFRGDDAHSVLRQVLELEVKPLRDMNRDVPAELERICMKAISKRASDRHQTALDFADDLRHFLSQNRGLSVVSGQTNAVSGPQDSQDTKERSSRINTGVIPRGLRSFGNADAHFFLDLLPGPYNRAGIPESVLFWKRHIEELDLENSFRVGLIYGPSGCGKSSFVKAGVIPTLSQHVTPIFVEAAPDATENRILSRLRRCCPYLDTDLGLRESIASLRHGHVMGAGKKVVLVIDQFEQWLYSAEHPEHSELANALRQCDGEHVQCILLVRDDFWLALSRFMEHLEVELRHSHNMMLVDLFDVSHARRVLIAFGRAFEQLPGRLSDMTRDQRSFISQAVDDLSDGGKVMPVRLALMAEMFKSKTWTTSTLRKIGGTEGVGVMFLDENFVSDNAPANYRIHQNAAYAMLGELLPQPGANLKGHMKSSDELLDASGYADRPKMFKSLVRTLDTELHLITRTDPEGQASDLSVSLSGNLQPKSSYYQLAHDYLVPSIRAWQSQMQRATRKGRAEIRLSERTEIWRARPDTRHLPTISEWISILALTRHRHWDEGQKRMMKAATRRYTTTLTTIGIATVLIALTLFQFVRWNRANALTDQLMTANVNQVQGLLDQMEGYERWTVERLTEIQNSSPPESHQRLFSSLALIRADRGSAGDLQWSLHKSDPETLLLVSDELRPYSDQLKDGLWKQLAEAPGDVESDSSGHPFNQRFNAALVLASYDPPRVAGVPPSDSNLDPEKNGRWLDHDDFVADQLIDFANIDRQYYPSLLTLIRPATSVLLDRLSQVMVDSGERELRRNAAQKLLEDLLHDDPVALTDRFLEASAEQIKPSLPRIDAHQDAVRPLLDQVAGQSVDTSQADWERAARRKAMAAALLLRHSASNETLWSVFRNDGIPDARTMLVSLARPIGVDPQLLAARLQIEQDNSIRCGLIQALGEYELSELKGDLKDRTVTLIKGWFGNANQGSLRSNALWFLRRFDQESWIEKMLWKPVPEAATRDWYVDGEGHTMIRLPKRLDDDRYVIEACVAEVTVAQFLRANPDFNWRVENAPTVDCAITHPTYHQAVAYCNWLTREMGLGDSELCYPDREDVENDSDPAVELDPDFRKKRGYRLATADEWFFIRMGGSQTDFPFGNAQNLADGFATFRDLGLRSWPIGTSKPNDFGIFDMLTGTREWVSEVDPENSRRRGLCGVSFRYSHFRNYEDLDIRPIGWGQPNLAYSFHGFRVVRSLPLDDEASEPPTEQDAN